MKRTPISGRVPVEVSPGTIGVVVQTERTEARTLGGLPYGAPNTVCIAVFPSDPLEGLGEQNEQLEHLRTKREIIVLCPGQKARVKVEGPLGSSGSYAFLNKEGRLHVRPAWLPWSRRRLTLNRTSKCDTSAILHGDVSKKA